MFEAIEALLKRNTVLFITALVTFELLLNAIIINKVGYTEIDWVAYMQEVNYFLNGERDYYLIKGDTGPLVYPAGFVYFYSAIHWITDGGANVRLGKKITYFNLHSLAPHFCDLLPPTS